MIRQIKGRSSFVVSLDMCLAVIYSSISSWNILHQLKLKKHYMKQNKIEIKSNF